MRLVGKACVQRCFGNRSAVLQLVLAELDAPIDQIGMRREAEMALEGANQVAGTVAAPLAQVVQRYFLAGMLVQIGGQCHQRGRRLSYRPCRLAGQSVHQRREVFHHFGLLVEQVTVGVQQAGCHAAVPHVPLVLVYHRCGDVLPVRCIQQSRLVAQCGKPLGIHVEHQVAPGSVLDGTAGVHPAGVHHHQGTGPYVMAFVQVAEGTLPRGDRPQRPLNMTVRRVADLASILYLAQLHMGHACIAPEQWLGGGCHDELPSTETSLQCSALALSMRHGHLSSPTHSIKGWPEYERSHSSILSTAFTNARLMEIRTRRSRLDVLTPSHPFGLQHRLRSC